MTSAVNNLAASAEMWAVEDLIPYARNAKKHSDNQVKKLAKSIEEFGFTMPVLVAEDGTIIAGHGRVLAAKYLALEEVPVVVARDWSEEKRRAYTIADNKLSEIGGGWDEELLKIELDNLLSEGEFSADMMGFDDKEIGKLFAEAKAPSAPEEFPSYGEDIATEHQCPKCGYQWSGKVK
ncbi:ParB N-terminal domain-containing protein [Brucella anthropi]|uniref:ParB domain protein nuclease n=1 Tax=Brucella anthropi (strain ATCC 49188 / DSM 6882 / CCUG 24695 / JCM 21032 / LMG 3331 / NBRC 15819 / NCTC 12168 / Alc 37) TaxID=439375 RepID=A6WZ23_BRUA4|nr:ParB/Srx family N-terminal domain-containing protein [Brucella anthropi]ABS14227.1 ParB domain protein nuclease [Brucella anthropi ATCC 49188]QQC25753.1 ParB N-terminal domain-containing protein [Brucella anthropi]SUA65544.1 ParB/RepB/Spo0J family partition protein [Brucella anthropi]